MQVDDNDNGDELMLRMPRLPRLCGMEGAGDEHQHERNSRGKQDHEQGEQNAMNAFFFDDELVGMFGLSSPPSPIDAGKRIGVDATTTIKTEINASMETATERHTSQYDATLDTVTQHGNGMNGIAGERLTLVPTPLDHHHMQCDNEDAQQPQAQVVVVPEPTQPMTNTLSAQAVGGGAMPPAPPAFGGVTAKIPTATTKTDTKTDATVKRRRCVKSTSCFRGVTHHCRTGRWESHIWDNGKQIYLGGASNITRTYTHTRILIRSRSLKNETDTQRMCICSSSSSSCCCCCCCCCCHLW